ncbi:MAG: TetR-like C-terminal domain-containing protein, partial [Clostridium sp.]
RDIFDLMEQIENELLEELEDVLNHFKASDLLSNPALVFTRVFHLVKENSDMVSILIGQNGDINFVNRLKDIVREKCLKDWMELFRPGAGGGRQTSRSSQNTLLDDSAFEAYYSFTVTGCIGLVQYWLDSGLKETPEQLASLVEQIISKGLRMFQPEAGL